MRGRRAFPASTVPRKPQQQKMRICSIAKGPLKERAFLLAYEMASGNLKHCARVGRDQGGSIKGANVFSFNPRARVGRDIEQAEFRRGHGVSIHAPVRGATAATSGIENFPTVSIHAPARGATEERYLRFLEHLVSIHAPAWGATTIYKGCRDIL